MRKYVNMKIGLKMMKEIEEQRFRNALEYLESCIDYYDYRCTDKSDIAWLKRTMEETDGDKTLYDKILCYCI